MPQPLKIAREPMGRSIRAYRWHSRAARNLRVVLVHGLGDHGRALPYELLADLLVEAGFPVLSFDQRGHGDIDGSTRGRSRLAELVDDLCTVVAALRRDDASARVALVGLSMGAVVALLAARQQPAWIAGVVAASLPIGTIKASRISLLAAAVLGRLLPARTIASGIDLSRVADDADAVRRYRADPLVHDRVALGLGADLLAARADLRELVVRPPCPTLVLHGEADAIAPWDAHADPAMASAGSEIRLLAGGHHNLFLDQHREQALLAIAGWLNRLDERGDPVCAEHGHTAPGHSA